MSLAALNWATTSDPKRYPAPLGETPQPWVSKKQNVFQINPNSPIVMLLNCFIYIPFLFAKDKKEYICEKITMSFVIFELSTNVVQYKHVWGLYINFDSMNLKRIFISISHESH